MAEAKTEAYIVWRGGAIKEFCGFQATLFVDIELQKSTNIFFP